MEDAEKQGRQLTLNFIINSLQDYARENGLKFPEIDKELVVDIVE